MHTKMLALFSFIAVLPAISAAPNGFGSSSIANSPTTATIEPVVTGSPSVSSVSPSPDGSSDITLTSTASGVVISIGVTTPVSIPDGGATGTAFPVPVSSSIVPYPETTFIPEPFPTTVVSSGGDLPSSTIEGPLPTGSSGSGAGCVPGHSPFPGTGNAHPNEIALKFGGEWVTYELKPICKPASTGVPHGTGSCGPVSPVTSTLEPPVITATTSIPLSSSASTFTVTTPESTGAAPSSSFLSSDVATGSSSSIIGTTPITISAPIATAAPSTEGSTSATTAA